MESIGQTLKAARERRQLSISDVVAATKMTSTFVCAIEADNFGALVAPIYARGFIKLYAEYVGLDPMPLLKQFSAHGQAAPARPQSPSPARAALTSSKAPPMKAPVAHTGKSKPKPAPISKSPLSWSASLPAERWPALNWTLIANIRWPQFRKLGERFRRVQLPLMVWRRIVIVAGVVLLIVAASLAWEWSSRGMPSMTDACRWLAEPPAPYLTMEERAPIPGR